ncbi:MAG: murein L,D-transpeptidase YcbB/YkuD [Sphingobacteriales bacterium]
MGKVNLESVDAEWGAIRGEVNVDLYGLLNMAIEKNDVTSSISSIKPKQKTYQEMRVKLQFYKTLQERVEIDRILVKTPLKLNDSDTGVPTLAQRLSAENIYRGDLDVQEYTQELFEAVKVFQSRNGLEPDGVIGKETLEQLNMTFKEKISQLKVDLERFRWMPESFGEDYVFVNIANFELLLMKNGKKDGVFRAVVGKPFRKTPVFSAKMTYLVLNPTWTVPPTILAKDVILGLKKNSGYLKSKNMQVVNRTGKVIPSSSIDWSSVSAKSFPYYVRQ